MPTTSSARVAFTPALVLFGAACAFLTGLVALAGPAAAIEDPRRPTAEVTHGPSCGPSVVRVAVTNGSEPHAVTLVFNGATEQDSATLDAGEQAELTSGEIDWGQTVDVAVTVTGADGTAGEPFAFGTYTRPSAEDCAALSPTTPSPAPNSSAAPVTPSTSPTPRSTTASPTRPRPSSPARPTGPAPATPSTTTGSTDSTTPDVTPDGDGEPPSGQAGSASSASVSPGGVVTVRAGGFTPGELVTVSLLGVVDPLATVAAGADGSVEAVVQIPRGAALGTATVQLVGGVSAATAGLDLQVAARERPLPGQTATAPALTAGVTLIGTAGFLGLMAARRSRGHHTPTPR